MEGGGRLKHFELLKGKPFLMVSSNAKSRPRAQQICDAAKAAGLVEAGFTFLVIRFDEEEAIEMSHLLARITQAISETTE